MLQKQAISERIRCSSFRGASGVSEHYLAIHCQDDLAFPEALEQVHRDYLAALEKLGLSAQTQVFTRVFLSDVSNQSLQLGESELFALMRDGAYSVIQQCPLNSGDLSLFAYHIGSEQGPLEKSCFDFDSEHWRNAVKVTGRRHDMYWTGNFSGMGQSSSFEQTGEIFESFNAFINSNGLTLLNNTVRTWLYVRDVDNNYQGMVDSRKEYFYVQGLNPSTRYIASTGIEAKMAQYYSLVSMDALSLSGLAPGQIVRMEALDKLCSTDDYGVTFERGSKLVLGDRSHLFISGTASIDNRGEVLHPADVIMQTHRTLDNVEALLNPHQATLADMSYLIVYLRNIKDAHRVMKALLSRVDAATPVFMVQAPVCRPSWLVEIEGVGIVPSDDSGEVFF
jgi:enamine deaminase RidA (YjgF/YER057c/UK114 family)